MGLYKLYFPDENQNLPLQGDIKLANVQIPYSLPVRQVRDLPSAPFRFLLKLDSCLKLTLPTLSTCLWDFHPEFYAHARRTQKEGAFLDTLLQTKINALRINTTPR